MINALDYGFIAYNEDFDNSLVFNNFLLESYKTHSNLYFPPGIYYFNTRPNPIQRPLHLHGEGVNLTSLVRNYSEAYNTPFLDIRSTSRVRRFALTAHAGTKRGACIRLQGNRASGSVIEDIWLNASNTSGMWDDGIVTEGVDSMGVRDFRITEVHCFSCLNTNYRLNNVRSANLNINAYTAGGSTGSVVIDDGFNVQLRGDYCENVSISDSSNVIVDVASYGDVEVEDSRNVRVNKKDSDKGWIAKLLSL